MLLPEKAAIFIHASRVKLGDTFRTVELGIDILSDTPLKLLVFPNLPSTIVVPIASPLLLYVLASFNTEPLVSFMWRRRTVLASVAYSPGKRALADVVKLHAVDHPLVPAGFVALTRQ